jgi:hypothetical protein
MTKTQRIKKIEKRLSELQNKIELLTRAQRKTLTMKGQRQLDNLLDRLDNWESRLAQAELS